VTEEAAAFRANKKVLCQVSTFGLDSRLNGWERLRIPNEAFEQAEESSSSYRADDFW